MVSDAECEEKAIAWALLSDGTISFTLNEEKEVSLGIIVNLTGQSSFGISAFKLEGIAIEPLTPEDPTGIESLTPSFSQRRGEIFDLSGRKISSEVISSHSTLKKGIYIMDGHKVLVK